MKDHATKTAFIELRAEGLSFAAIAERLHISKSTCSAWEKELTAEISSRRGEREEELYSLYGMSREARVRRLGDTLTRINSALAEKDLAELGADKLLALTLQYEKAMREEYRDPAPAVACTEESLTDAMLQLLTAQQNGTISARDAGQQLEIIKALLRRVPSDPFDFMHIA